MNSALEAMLSKYDVKNSRDRENAIKEIVQEIALSGLSQAGFFDNVAFYGGTCLRIFYDLNRFSEDLDFALVKKNPDFELNKYFPALEKTFNSFGLDIRIESKEKETEIKSAFLKGNTLLLMFSFFPNTNDASDFISNQKIKIKFEVDTDNPVGGTTEVKYKMLPSPYEVKVFDESTLFAGKIHAIICRTYKNHVKGRDYYDYLFYVGKGSKINLQYLENKLKNTGGIIDEKDALTLEMVKKLLAEKFSSVDYESAKEDVIRFIKDDESLKIWKKELFLSTLDQLESK